MHVRIVPILDDDKKIRAEEGGGASEGGLKHPDIIVLQRLKFRLILLRLMCIERHNVTKAVGV